MNFFRRNAEDIASFVLLILILVGIVIAILNVGTIVAAVGQITAATIGALGAVVVAILGHWLTQRREQKLEEHRALKKNYMDILERIDKLIRERRADDQLSCAFLQSYVVGSRDVIEKSRDLLEATSDPDRTKAVKKLLEAMRADVGLPNIEIGRFPPLFTIKDQGTLAEARQKSE